MKKNILLLSTSLLVLPSMPLILQSCENKETKEMSNKLNEEIKVANSLINQIDSLPKYETLQSDVTELKKLIEESKKVLSSKKSANELKVQFEKLAKMAGNINNKKWQIDNRDTTFDNLDASNSLSIISDKLDQFYKAIADKKDFYYDYKNNKMIAVEADKRPNWQETNEYLIDVKIKDLANGLQIANAKEPTYESHGKTQVSGKIDYEINADGEIIFSYKIGFYNKGNPKISETIFTTNLGKPLSEEEQKEIAKLEEAEKKTTFSYSGDISNTLLKDADLTKVVANVPEGFEIESKKMVPNDETGFYELTILFKLKSKKANVSSKKNKEFALKGLKKTPEKIAEQEQAKKIIEEETKNIKAYISNEAAYQDIIKRNAIAQENQTPNFVISGYDSSKFIATATEVKVEDVNGKKEITISYEIHAIVNKDIKVQKTDIQVETNYNKDVINPHNLSAEECKNFLTNAIKDEKICPFYSKDKTYIEKLNNLNLSNKSFFIEGKKLNNLIYNFGNVYKKDNKYYVEAELSFAYWPESPKVKIEKEIELEKLGVNILNEGKNESNKIQDIEAPTGTITEQFEPTLDLSKFTDSDSDDANGGPAINPIKKNTLSYINSLACYNKDLYDQMVSGNFGNKKLLQHLKYDATTFEAKSNVYFLPYNTFLPKEMYSEYYAYVFSSPIYDQVTKKLTIKISIVSTNDLNAGNTKDQVASKRVEVVANEFLQGNITKYLFTKSVFDLRLKGSNFDQTKPASEVTIDILKQTLEEHYTGYVIENVEVDHSKSSEGKLLYKFSAKKDSFESFVLSLTISKFKK